MRLALSLAAALFFVTFAAPAAADVLPPADAPEWDAPPAPQPKDISLWLAVAIAAVALGGVAVVQRPTPKS